MRARQDYYTTPLATVAEFFVKFQELVPALDLTVAQVFDPAAGGCAENIMTYPAALRALGCENIDTLDIRQDSRAAIIADYMNFYPEKEYDLIITNPPFNLALDYIVTALEDCKSGGYVVMLLRLNFFGSLSRKEFFSNNMPLYCFVHTQRPRFNKNSSENAEYAHFVWKKGYNPPHTQTYLL
ncbi:hypothetical protein [Hymenobacter sublimis]|uniref:SAM-dependent methyltransferase n=1 Tax=Hymenobacter sublimis TaxID=2933777 RepID=A0ABY4JF21_9BACT|nr:hypothetical protein [Hymenobacter sublimis]UPL50539.1 hypothetical protein MWH26_06430 [Hymenobacter sublimis]